jgi:hypothetical protein
LLPDTPTDAENHKLPKAFHLVDISMDFDLVCAARLRLPASCLAAQNMAAMCAAISSQALQSFATGRIRDSSNKDEAKVTTLGTSTTGCAYSEERVEGQRGDWPD